MNMTSSKSHSGYLRPPFDADSAELAICLRCAKALQTCDPTTQAGASSLAALRTSRLDEAERCRKKQHVRVIISVLFDLRSQGWDYAVADGQVQITRPQQLLDGEQAKARVRTGHAPEREAQLRKPSVRRFVQQMEEPRLFGNQWVSILSLMRDGRALADGLGRLAQEPNAASAALAIRSALRRCASSRC